MLPVSTRPSGRVAVWLCLAICLNAVAHSQTRRALLIGIDHYAPPPGSASPVPTAGHAPDSRFGPGESWPELHGPSADVASMQVLLKNSFGFRTSVCLTNSKRRAKGFWRRSTN
jgi:hypothetical protein